MRYRFGSKLGPPRQVTSILPWLIDLLEHTYHVELNPTLTRDYEGGSERIKGIASVLDS